ncbi:AMP-binding protein [Ramlibacter sp. AW1]|uniref:Long-chain-fatty-acid--CoA ligase n=1 Tax=Ramlibacter aurantiacus TaxID=2801330 RepID=A0A936ZNS8_9BURK|nr:AMP-binding protein [Ramlibacter aurantiacus]MBL0420708.1 AMP-binding protein [Ramlibacter aurantiacus]
MAPIHCPIEGVTYHPPERAARWLADGSWVDGTVGDALRASARRHPDRLALISDERSLSYAELDEATERLAAALLQAGLNPGDRAMFQMGTTVETAIALLACFKAGVVPVCSLPQHREVEIGQLARQTGARGYFVQADFGAFDLVAFARQMMQAVPSLQHLVVARGKGDVDGQGLQALIGAMPLETARKLLERVRLGPRDVLSFQLSGGSTGLPKIIPRFHGEYLAHAAGWQRVYGIGEQARVIWSLPLLHNAGQLYALIPMAASGVTTVLMPRVDIARMLELIEAHRVTHALSIGPIAPQLLAYRELARHDLSSLRLFATMSRADLLEAHLGVPCSNLYGITEGMLLGSGPDAPAFRRHHTQGASGCPADELVLLDPQSQERAPAGGMGELCFRGPSTLAGYYASPETNASAFTREGFYRTGDMMRAHVVDGVTCYSFEGRLRDNINRGGEKIGCEEVEEFVSRHPAVADAKLVAMPDPFYGEKGCVFLVLRPGMAAPDVKELAQFLVGQGLAKYKCPERVEVVDAFPVTRVGKVDKAALRATAAQLVAQGAGA